MARIGSEVQSAQFPDASTLRRPFEQLEDLFYHGVPWAQWQYVTVTFPAAPNTDLDVQHGLAPPTVDAVDYIKVGADRACRIYHDQTGTHKAWGNNVIYLRSDVASAVVTLLLTVRRTSVVS